MRSFRNESDTGTVGRDGTIKPATTEVKANHVPPRTVGQSPHFLSASFSI